VRLKLLELPHQLKKSYPSVLWISGHEALLNEEAAESIVAHFKNHHFSHERFFAPDFSWPDLDIALQNQALFAEKRLIDIDLRQEKLTPAIQAILLKRAQAPADDTVLLIRANERETAFLKTKWFKSFEEAAWVQINYRARLDETEAYCRRLIQAQALSPVLLKSSAALAHRYQGDLLGLKQALLHFAALNQEDLRTEDLREWLDGGVSGSLYDWVNYLLVGNLDQALPLFAKLKETGAEPSLLMWALVRQLKRVYQVSLKTASLQSPAFYTVSKEDKTAITQACNRIDLSLFPQFWAMAADIDAVIKGVAQGDAYQLISAFSLWVGGAKTA